MGAHDHHSHHVMENTNTTNADLTTVATTLASVLQSAATTVMSHIFHGTAPPTAHSRVHDDGSTTHHHSGDGAFSNGNEVDGDHMKMYFHSSYDSVILFKSWTTSTYEGLIWSVFAIILLSVLFEGIKYFREYLFKKYFTALEYSSVSVLADDGKNVTEVHKIARNRMLSLPHFFQTILQVVQNTLGYSLMLIAMTYNIWLFMGVVIGSGLGYFIFGWKKATIIDITEHCQ